MLTKLKLALLIAAPLAGAATYAGAKDHAPPQKLVEKFDANGDAKLDDAERATMKEARQARRLERIQQALATFDVDQNGKLDPTERAAMRDARLTERFAAMDKDGDGALTLAEFKAAAPAHRGMHRHGRRGHGKHHAAPVAPAPSAPAAGTGTL
jgi:EF hand